MILCLSKGYGIYMNINIFNDNLHKLLNDSSNFNINQQHKSKTLIGFLDKSSGTLSDKKSCKVDVIYSNSLRNLKNFEHATDHAVLINANEKGIEIITASHNIEKVRKSLFENRTFTVMHPDGTEITHDVNNISIRAFTAEEFTILEKALANYFNTILAERRKAEEAKVNGSTIEMVNNTIPEISSAKLKNNKTVPAFKNTLDPEFPGKALKTVIAQLLTLSSLRQQRIQEETLQKEDKIKDQELKRSELRQEIVKDSIKQQSEQVEKIGKRNKRQKVK